MTDELITSSPAPFVLDRAAYLARIDYKGTLEPTLETLEALQFAHVSAIPFENLDIMLGKTISLDLPHLEAKLVKATAGRILLRAKRALRRRFSSRLASKSCGSRLASVSGATDDHGRALICCSQ